MTPFLTWEDVAKALRIEPGENNNKERLRKRKVMRIMRQAGGFELGKSNWRVSEENLNTYLRKIANG